MSELSPYADLFTRLEGVRAGFNEQRQTLLAEKEAALRERAQLAGGGELAPGAKEDVDARFAPKIKALEDEEARVVEPMARELQRLREQKDPSLAAQRLDAARARDGGNDPAPAHPPREPGGG